MAVIRFADMLLDDERGQLDRAGTPVSLRPKAFALLSYFLHNPDRVISKEELVEAVWHQAVVTDDALAQTIKDVRRAIGDSDAVMLKSFPKRGYLFALAAAAPEPDDEDRPAIHPTAPHRTSPRSVPPPRIYATLLACAIFTLAGISLWLVAQSRPGPVKTTPSIVVLAFDDLTPARSASQLATHIADDLTIDLASISGLRILSRKTTFYLQGKPSTPQQIGKALAVRYLIQGSVRHDGDVVRVNVELVDTRDGTTVWARRFRSTLGQLNPLQDQIRSAITEQIRHRTEQGRPHPAVGVETAALGEPQASQSRHGGKILWRIAE